MPVRLEESDFVIFFLRFLRRRPRRRTIDLRIEWFHNRLPCVVTTDDLYSLLSARETLLIPDPVAHLTLKHMEDFIFVMVDVERW